MAPRALQSTIILALFLAVAPAGAELPPEVAAKIDRAVARVLEETGVPSASVAVVHDGEIALTKAYGRARLDPPVAATPAMRYPVGSISKQFTAAALILLAEDGRLSLDDKVAKFHPELERAGDITVRQLLSHTAGIRDYWPQDYVPATMLAPITTQALMTAWAGQPLDFEPGTKWQYSNTGYVIAGAIAEKASGKPLLALLTESVFTPLGMNSVIDVDQGRLADSDPTGYRRVALGPLRIAPKEGKGWLFAAGGLAMTAEDLARWDLALIDGSLAHPGMFRQLATEILLANGVGTGYGLGVGLALEGGRRVVAHGGEVSGFTATNNVYPEDRAAVAVLTNQDAAGASAMIARQIADLIFVAASPTDAEALARVKGVLEDLRRGTIDRSLLTSNGNAYFSDEALADVKSGLGKLGSPQEVTQVRQSLRGGLTTRVYRAVYKKKTLEIVTRAAPDGRFEQITLGVG
jgi:D-alanyl-D-alanine carboxypeptidase